MNYEITASNGVLVVKVNAQRATVEMATDFKEALIAEIDRGKKNIVVDLTQTEFVDSSFLGALVTGLKRSSMKEGDLKIVGLQPPVRAMFELTRLYRIFDIFDTTEDAISSFKQ